MRNKKNIFFNFGKNWQAYSAHSLNNQKFNEALGSLRDLIGEGKIKNSKFLDVGCGSGIFAIAASKIGAKEVVGIDISEESISASLQNQKTFAPFRKIRFFRKSILDKDIFNLGKFDIVYSWGVLHHTGKMQQAIENTLSLVKKDGLLVLAIYNKHWSSPFWKIIKMFYNISPNFIKKALVFVFYWVIILTKLLITKKNPLKNKRRGMNFYYDVIDWLGGYPYEYASKDEIKNFVEKKNFKLVKFVKAPVPTGCNEFVFKNYEKNLLYRP